MVGASAREQDRAVASLRLAERPQEPPSCLCSKGRCVLTTQPRIKGKFYGGAAELELGSKETAQSASGAYYFTGAAAPQALASVSGGMK